MEALIAVSVFLFVTTLMWMVFTRPEGDVKRRLRSFREIAIVEEQAAEEQPSFIERVVRPVLLGLRRFLSVALPSSFAHRIEWQLTVAGDPVGLTSLYTIWGCCALGLPGLYFLATMASGGLGQQQLGVLLLIGVVGIWLPYQWLKIKAGQRQTAILKGMPDAIDLLTTSVEAGLGIDAALGQVAEKVRGPISAELRRVLREMAMGSARRDALRAFADRTTLPDVKQFVNAIVQAEQMGVSLGQVIRIQSDQMRLRRRQRAEAKAHAAPVKMAVPMVLFIFPTILVVILGPAMIQIMHNIGGK